MCLPNYSIKANGGIEVSEKNPLTTVDVMTLACVNYYRLTEMERRMVGVHIVAADHRTPQIGALPRGVNQYSGVYPSAGLVQWLAISPG